ncbi:MAG: hypothetical protein R2710_19460 [Acidimicrobiales bacterium]
MLPTVPPVVGDFAAGVVSTPVFPQRSGSTESGGVDLPVPDGWEADPSLPSANVTGRGGLVAATFDLDDPAWRTMADPAELVVTEGPTAIAVPLYRATPDGVVTTGASASIQQYRHGSSDPGTWLRRVVWVYPTTISSRWSCSATRSSPKARADSDDPLQRSLAGQDPMTIMHDVRFFGSN